MFCSVMIDQPVIFHGCTLVIIKKYEFSSYSLILEMAERWDFMKEDARICPKRLKQSRLLILATSLASLVVMCRYKQRTVVVLQRYRKNFKN